jgi:arginase
VTRQNVAIIGAELDLGAGRRGVDMGPSAIRYAGLGERIESLGLEATDWGNVDAALRETVASGDEDARFLSEIKATCERVAFQVTRARSDGLMPLVLGGDHSIALGTVGGMASAHGAGAAIWLDAHGDLNRPDSSPTGNVHGMPLAAALGACSFEVPGFGGPPWVDPARVALVGVRSLDPGERALVRELGLRVLTMSDVDRRGVAAVMAEALDIVSGTGFVHLSFDADVCDPEIAPGVGTPVPGGLSYREAHLAMELCAESGMVTSMEAVEVNPMLDHESSTRGVVVEFIASALGARIL